MGYDDEHCSNDDAILQYLKTLNAFCLDKLGCDLYNFKVHSLASLAMLFLNKYNTTLFAKFSEDVLAFTKPAFFGGRCELYAPGEHTYATSFDFPSMYGNILTGYFPKDFS